MNVCMHLCMYREFVQDAEVEDLDRVPTVDEKMQLGYEIFRISNHELARVLTMIEEKCPSALLRNHSADEVPTYRCFTIQYVCMYVCTCMYLISIPMHIALSCTMHTHSIYIQTPDPK